MSSVRNIILNFHGIGTPHADVDASERPYWIDESFFRRIVDMALARPDADRVLWTFDDGNRSDLTIGARVLAEAGRRGMFFLLTGRFGHPDYLSHDDARALAAMGMEIGLHGRDHVDWRHVPPAQLAAETVDARAMLAEVVGRPVDRVAIPFGAYNRKVIAHLQRCGFSRIYTSDGGACRPNQRISNRTSIRCDMSLDRVAAILDDRASLARRLKRNLSTNLRRYIR